MVAIFDDGVRIELVTLLRIDFEQKLTKGKKGGDKKDVLKRPAAAAAVEKKGAFKRPAAAVEAKKEVAKRPAASTVVDESDEEECDDEEAEAEDEDQSVTTNTY